MGILILKKACYRVIIEVFTVKTIIKMIIMTLENNDYNSINNNNNK